MTETGPQPKQSPAITRAPDIAGLVERCPFCNAAPHKGPTKVQHDQLHGEAFQRYRFWCPHGCASIERVNEDQAREDWNTRPGLAAALLERDEALQAVDAFSEICVELGVERDNESGLIAAHDLKAKLTAAEARLSSARDEGMEMAAKVADGFFEGPGVAAAIRALKGTKP